MPSGPKKRKSKRKGKASVSPPHQGWLRSHMQMLKGPSLGNGTKGKGKHNLTEKEADGNKDRKEEGKILFLFKGVEAAAAGEMDALESEGSHISSLSTAGLHSESENSQNIDDSKMLALDKSEEDLQETENLECAVSNGFPGHYGTSDNNFDRSGSKVDDTEAVVVDNSFKETTTLQGEGPVPAIEVFETGEATLDKIDVKSVLEAKNSASEKDYKLMIDAGMSNDAPQNEETYAITPKTEISRPLIAVRRASVWNCCGLLEVLTSFQH